MANEEHLALLKRGVETWNEWRREHLAVQIDLGRADLHGADLRGVHLSEAHLRGSDLSGARLRGSNLINADLSWAYLNWAYLSEAHLSEANLINADLRGSDLSEADLRGAHLSEADLRGAHLSEAHLSQAYLINADLSGADLSGADLSGAHLSGADLRNARMGSTGLNELDLRLVKGLETVRHFGRSDIGIQTIYLSKGEIPEIFLRGAGVPENFIEYIHSLTGKAFEYYSCFLSYSSQDQEFAERLYADLQAKGVRCWFAPHDLKIGDKFWERIDESIRLHDMLLVILSEHSVESDWVEDEVTRALEKERQHPERTVLFPIRLDEAVMSARHAWASGIRQKRHIGDFTGWKDHDQYQQALARLLRDLQASDAPPAAV